MITGWNIVIGGGSKKHWDILKVELSGIYLQIGCWI